MRADAQFDTSTLPKAVAEMHASQRQSECYSQSGNNNGQIVSITDNQQSGRTVNYTYDSLHRLKTAVTNGSVAYAKWGLSWSYDRYGNRTGQSVTHGSGPSNSPTISTTNNRITALGAANYSYDANGSLTQDDLFKYKYDAENRLVEIRNLSNTLLSSYAYDGNGMQVIKVVGAWRQWFIYAGAQLVSEYSDAASATYTSPTSPGSAPSDSLSTVLYQHSDHLTTRVTTENDGDLSNQQAHYPYGEHWYSNGTADPSVKRKFTSYRKETDGSLATGQINYAVARYHGARIGRFHRPDPVRGRIKNPQRLNRYAYVTGNPINRIDPRGTDDLGPCFGGECLMQDFPNWGTPEDALFANPTWQNFNVSVGLAPNAFGPEWIVGPRPGPGGGGGSCICGCSCWDVLCVISGILFGCKETGCKVTLSDRSGSPACNSNEVFIKTFECTGEYECCRAEKRKFGDWCMDLPENERKDLEYATARYWNWSSDTLHCCGGLKAKK